MEKICLLAFTMNLCAVCWMWIQSRSIYSWFKIIPSAVGRLTIMINPKKNLRETNQIFINRLCSQNWMYTKTFLYITLLLRSKAGFMLAERLYCLHTKIYRLSRKMTTYRFLGFVCKPCCTQNFVIMNSAVIGLSVFCLTNSFSSISILSLIQKIGAAQQMNWFPSYSVYMMSLQHKNISKATLNCMVKWNGDKVLRKVWGHCFNEM